MSDSLLAAAMAAYDQGDFAACIRLCESGLAGSRHQVSLLVLKGLAHQARDELEATEAAFRRVAELEPGVPEYWSNLGFVQRLLGHHGDAESSLLRALSLAPTHPDALINHGLLLLDQGRIAEARHRFLDAVDAAPELPAGRIYAALACFECGDARRAESLIPPKATWPHLDSELRHDLAMALMQVGRVTEAEDILQEEARLYGDPSVLARLALLHERTNRVDSAATLLDRISDRLHHGSRDMRADALTAEAALAIRQKDYDRARRAGHELLGLGLPAQARASAYFTLARIADKQDHPAEAMEMLENAHRLHFDLAKDIVPEIAASGEEPLRIASRWLTPEQAAFVDDPSAPGRDSSPVFIVGYPRSGTTMLEQMLDAHPRFVSMDERAILQRCIERMESAGFAYPEGLIDLPVALLAELRQVYWHEVAKVAELAPGQTLVDKNPLNMLRLPMIRRLFPHSRVILALRHPCDVILSCYMQNFRSPAFMVLCSTLQRLASSYASAMRFWIHHQPLLAPDALVLRYEDTVTHFGRQVARIADYLGIAESGYLADFAAHAARKGFISTPSYSQVVEPVNTRAVARWHRYWPWLEPTLPTLQPVADHWGYRLDPP